jgi:glutathione S-transferase
MVNNGSELTLWGIGTSRTMRAHWALHEASLSYACEQILPRTGQTQTAEYTALNVRQKVPLLQDGSFTIGESAAIAAYVARKCPRGALIPEGLHEHAIWLEWCFFLMTELDATSLYVMRRHRELEAVYGAAPEVVGKASLYFQKQLQFVSQAMQDGRPYLCGSSFTIADILLTTCLTWAAQYGIPVGKDLMSYLRTTTARETYRAAFLRNRGDGDAMRYDSGHWRHFE